MDACSDFVFAVSPKGGKRPLLKCPSFRTRGQKGRVAPPLEQYLHAVCVSGVGVWTGTPSEYIPTRYAGATPSAI